MGKIAKESTKETTRRKETTIEAVVAPYLPRRGAEGSVLWNHKPWRGTHAGSRYALRLWHCLVTAPFGDLKHDVGPDGVECQRAAEPQQQPAAARSGRRRPATEEEAAACVPRTSKSARQLMQNTQARMLICGPGGRTAPGFAVRQADQQEERGCGTCCNN